MKKKLAVILMSSILAVSSLVGCGNTPASESGTENANTCLLYTSLNEQMNNPEFAQEYNAVQPEMDAIRSMIKARKSQNLTQKQLAELVGIDQGDISKLENGLRNPTIQLLKRIADSMNMTLKIEFIPKQQNNKKKI